MASVKFKSGILNVQSHRNTYAKVKSVVLNDHSKFTKSPNCLSFPLYGNTFIHVTEYHVVTSITGRGLYGSTFFTGAVAGNLNFTVAYY